MVPSARSIRALQTASFVVLGGLGAALTPNVPGILVGYGLLYILMLLASWQYRPKVAALVVLGAMLVAFPLWIVSASVFTFVAVLAAIISPALTYVVSWVNLRLGRFASAVTLSAVQTLIALTISIVYFGLGGSQVGFAIFSILLAPFAHAILTSTRRSGAAKILALLGSLVSLLTYYFSFYSFVAIWTGITSLGALGILLLRPGSGSTNRSVPVIALALALAGLFLGGSPLSSNLSISLYPLNPHNWGDARWEQLNPGECPATNNVFSATYAPARLRIVSTCVTVLGTVGSPITAEEDGDFTFDLRLSEEHASMLSIGNLILLDGKIHIEVVPVDRERVLTPIGGGVCPGDLLRVSGVFVVDTDHGMYTEVHPAYNIAMVNRASGASWPACIITQ